MGGKLKALFAQTDMTVGKPWKQIVIFTIPMLIGNIAQQLYNTVDSIVVGKYVGDNALAAVGSASPILNLLLVLFIGISMGTSIMVSQFFGAKDRESLSKTIGSTITLTAVSSLIIMVLGSVTIRPLLKMLNTPASIIDWCTSYLLILIVGIMGVAYYNMFCGILRGLGDSLSALVYLLVATVINIVLDLWFVAGLQMGVAGVALATVIAQMVSAVLCFFKLKRMTDVFDLKFKYLKPDMDPASGASVRYHPGHLLHGYGRGSVADQQLRRDGDCGQRYHHACGWIRHDAELLLWYGDDHIFRSECRRERVRPGT